jgi:excisionase family DNA binding protein
MNIINTMANKEGYVSIGEAARYLGVSLDTVRRWERAGKLQAQRLDGKNRYFSQLEMEKFKVSKPLSTAEVAAILNLSESTIRRLELKGVLKPLRDQHGRRLYTPLSVNEYFARKRVAFTGGSAANVAMYNMINESEQIASSAKAINSADSSKLNDHPRGRLRGYVALIGMLLLILVMLTGISLA